MCCGCCTELGAVVSSQPALYATPLQGLYPAGAVVAALRGAGDLSILDPEEARCVARAVPARVAEFAAGRLCARLALAELGVVGFPLLAAPDRSPVWPLGVVGSISHTAGHCAVVAGSRTQFLGLGLDTELLAAVHAGLWSKLCTPPEHTRLGALPAAQRARAAALIFAAKEAFYKMQYPLTRERLDFDAVAHNELYRKLIKGYMVRHKVLPGITGLAQISGARGETVTVADMEARVKHDLDYLRHWSPMLDFKIMVLTVLKVFGDDKAY